MEKFAKTIDTANRDEMLKIVRSSLGTKFVNRFQDLFCDIAIDAVSTVLTEEGGRKEIDIKKYVRIEKVFYLIRKF